MHLQPGSLRVKAGDRVRRGKVLARVGGSGRSRAAPAFRNTTSSKLLAGVPYLTDRYRCESRSDEPKKLHTHELPLDHSVITFGEHRRN
jgi:hypothetical protein